MIDKVWVYQSRNGETMVFNGDHEGWLKARMEQDNDNRATLEEIIEQNDFEVGGDEESGRFYIDDGGDIELLDVHS